MKISLVDNLKLSAQPLDLLVFGLFSADKPKALPAPCDALKQLKLSKSVLELAHREGFEGKKGQVFYMPLLQPTGPKAVALIGLGASKEQTDDTLRRYGALAYRLAHQKRAGQVGVCFPDIKDTPSSIQGLAEGVGLARYRFDHYLTEDKPENYVKRVELGHTHTSAKLANAALTRAEIIRDAVGLARDLVNMGPLDINPKALAERATKEGKRVGLDVEVLDEKALAKEKMNLFLAVSRAALHTTPPRLIRLAYRPAKKAKQHLVLVGKGITFDTGGLDLKPPAGMLDMKSDMSGAACVLATMLAIAQLKPDMAVTGYLSCAENGIGANAYHPGDVIRSRKGFSVEIDNTDAEGRLVLADTMDYAQERDKPDYMIDVATLTGACIVALGESTAGIFTPSDEMAQALYSHGKKVGEEYWRLPLNDGLWDKLKSNVADFKNAGDRMGGSITAALFLQKFVKDGVKWTHLDIAGPATNEREHPYIAKGGSGFGVRTLVEFISQLPSSP